MNVDPVESLTSPSSINSNNSSSQSVSPTEDFETAPLRGLLDKPMDEMTNEELRARVMEIRRLRTTPQAFKAEVERSTKQRTAKASEKKIEKRLEALGDLL